VSQFFKELLKTFNSDKFPLKHDEGGDSFQQKKIITQLGFKNFEGGRNEKETNISFVSGSGIG